MKNLSRFVFEVASGFTFAVGLCFGSPADAAEKSSLPNYPPGLTIGTPAGILPKPGIYWTEKNFTTSIDPVDGNGQKTGAHLDSFATVAIVQFVPGWHLLGATYAFQFDSYGVFKAKIRFPDKLHLPSYSTVGTSDLAIRPLILSWTLPHHISIAIREGFYLPTGSYDAAKPLSVSHHRTTFEQGVALSYANKNWTLSANNIIDVNAANEDTLVNGQHQSYRSGPSYDVDLTALRNIDHLQIGPVGYYYHQFGADRGPVDLDGGIPTEVGVGGLIGYQFKKIYLNLYGVRDVYGRNVGIQSRIWLTIGFRVL